MNVTLRFPDGSSKEFPQGVTPLEVAQGISKKLAKAALAAKLDDKVVDMATPINRDCEISILTFDDEEGKHVFWHSSAHIMADAVQHLFPGVKFGIGPAIREGFYYDFDSEHSFTQEDLEAIEQEMLRIVQTKPEFHRAEVSREEALKIFGDRAEIYKVELIEGLADDAVISTYEVGDFLDLCAGPHIPAADKIKAVKILSIAGAYWRGSEKNKMLQRLYAITFPDQKMLDAHLKKLEEARKRDHNKLGRELEYFTTVDVIGQGLPVLLPNGARVVQLLQRWVEDEEQKRGYLLTKTPLMAKSDLYKISGHWDHYLDGMFVIGDPQDESKECLAMRPMTCPFQYQVFLNRMRSYRDLPMRLGETSTLFRNEDSGEMHGLIRVRQFTISEGHLILRPDQLEEEFKGCLELTKYMLDTLGLLEDVTFRFSQWDPNNKEKYIGTPEQWDEAQSAMQKILDDLGVEYSVGIDEAAFYGPKLDIQIRNVFGKEDTLVTIQIDQMLAELFGMEYVDQEGKRVRPYIIHRTSIGCYERTLALLIEKYAGAMPLWLSPLQVRVMNITDNQASYAQEVCDKLEAADFRADVDLRNEKIGYKIREAQAKKINYMLVVGDKEMESGTVAVRKRGQGDLGAQKLEELIGGMLLEVAEKRRD